MFLSEPVGVLRFSEVEEAAEERMPRSSPPPPPAAAAEEAATGEQGQSAPPRLPSRFRRVWVSYSVGLPRWSWTTRAVTRSDDTCSFTIAMATFCLFASLTLILGFSGTEDLVLGPNTSLLLQPNSLFSQEIRVISEGSTADPSGVVVYEFSSPPPIDVETTWTESRRLFLPPNTHQEWAYYLNGEAQLNVSYLVIEGYGSSSSLSLAIAEGKQSLLEWIDNPLFPDATLSWNLIQGNGLVNQRICRASDYYVAVANMNRLPVEVYLNFSIQASLYNTTGAHHKCSLNQSLCALELSAFSPNYVIITTSNTITDGGNEEWNVSVSLSPRWITYFLGSVAVTLIMVVALQLVSNLIPVVEGSDNEGHSEVEDERTPLISNKDDEDASMGSSYESVLHDEEEEAHHVDPNAVVEAERDGVSENLCVICFDAPKDSFFLPCGHCATCFPCGMKITEEAGICPFCRRRMKKVRRIYTI